jgi:hypothetical protein|tara:strand:- start:222 stop:551 length:330 start_codon:yes stop_codon:yes gene_type:complete
MANSYKFKGVALATGSETALLTAATDETLIIKSILVTNNTGNTPTLSLDVLDSSASAEFTILKTHTLTANTSGEVFTGSPLILESADALKATISSSDSIHFGISYMSVT